MKIILNLIILILWQAYLKAQQIVVDEVYNTGIQSTSLNSIGVYGISTYHTGVWGVSNNEYGTIGQTGSSDINKSGVLGTGQVARGVTGSSVTGIGVYGTSTGGYGVCGKSTNEIGVLGESTNSYGVWGNGKTYDFYAWKEDGSIAYGQSSSRRWKTNIINIPNPLEKMAQLRGVYFDWNSDHGGLHDVGFIAEEIGSVMPEIVGYEENGIDATGMDYSKMTPLLVEAANAMRKEYQEKFDEQRQLIDWLIATNASINEEIDRLKQFVNLPIAKTNFAE
ncbi:MAG: tail fiber domain-containing protein [Saprospiraceae bacterium]|nr:tail fiber domain-containing protein [Saprospiraceae bacterium]